MSLKGSPHNGPAKLSEGMVAIDVPPPSPASDYAIKLESRLHERDPDSWHDDYSLMPARRPHVVLVEPEPGKPHLRIGDHEPTRYADAVSALRPYAEQGQINTDGGSEPKRFTTPDGKHTLLILDDPVSVEARFHELSAGYEAEGLPPHLLYGDAPAGLDGGFIELSDAARLELHRMATVYGSGAVLVSEDSPDKVRALIDEVAEKTAHGLDHLERGAAKTDADALTDAVFAEAARRIAEQDREIAALKMHRKKRKARKKKADKSKRGNR